MMPDRAFDDISIGFMPVADGLAGVVLDIGYSELALVMRSDAEEAAVGLSSDAPCCNRYST